MHHKINTNMLRRLLFKPHKALPLGRWQTNTTFETIERKADLANCDSCGTCSIPEKEHKTSTFMVGDDIIDIGELVTIGSFGLHKKK